MTDTPTTDKRDAYAPTHNDIRGVLEASDVHEAPSIDLRAADSADRDGSHEITAAQQRQRQDMGMRYALASALNSELGGGQDKPRMLC